MEKANPPTPNARADDETITLLYEGVQGQLSAQDQQIAALDAKAGVVLGSASLLTAAAIALQSLTLQHAKSPWTPYAHGVEILAIAAYVVLVFASLQGYALRPYNFVPDPLKVPRYLFDTHEFVKGKLLMTAADAFRDNDLTVRQKVWWVKLSLISLLAEGVILGVVATIQIFI